VADRTDEEVTVEAEADSERKPSDDAEAGGEHTQRDDGEVSKHGASGDAESEESAAAVERPEDRTAERFLELEAELVASSDATLPDGTVRSGRLVDAALVPVAEVPSGYPVAVGSGQALALTVDLDGGRTVPAYLDWPEEAPPGEGSTLGRLLAGLDVAPEQLAELYGRQVLVEVVDGHYTLYVPAQPPRGDGRDIYGVIAGAVASIATLVGVTLSPSGLLLLAFLLVTLVALPLFTYRDGWYLRTHSDWEGGPLFWATLAMFPGVNLLSTGLYLLARNRATFLGG